MFWFIRFALAATVAVVAPGAVTAGAGSGAGGVSGYEVGNVRFVSPAGEPDVVSAVSFTLDGPAAVVRASLRRSSDWHSCTEGTSARWTCQIGRLPLAQVDQLRVVATETR